MPVSLIVAVRNWPIDRVLASNRSYAALSPDDLAEIIIVDFGSEHPVANSESGFDPRTRVVRVEADDFSLAEATNIGVLHATSALICKTDADIVFHPASLHGYRMAVRALESGEVDLSLTRCGMSRSNCRPPKAANWPSYCLTAILWARRCGRGRQRAGGPFSRS
jgi:glycosyltransferase involved in cell wall biosynthesis